MKKAFIIVLIAILLICFSACDETSTNGEINNTTDGQEATEGNTLGTNDSANSTGETTEDTVPKEDNTEKNPDSEEDKTDDNFVVEYVCPHSFLNFIPSENGWTSNVKIVKDATCETYGEKVQKCNLCSEEVVLTIPALGHETVIDMAISPTCIQDGKTEGSHCSRCNEVFVEQEAIPALGGGHVIVIDEAVEATCTETGLSEGKHCSRCGKIYVLQAIIPTKEHATGEWIVDKEPTCTENGKRHLECQDCDYREEELTSVPHQYSVNEENGKKTFSCDMCGRTIENVEDIIILLQKNDDGTYTIEVSGGYGNIKCKWNTYEHGAIYSHVLRSGIHEANAPFSFDIKLSITTSDYGYVLNPGTHIKITATDELGQQAVYNFKLSNAELISSEHTIVDKSNP